jgi:hypothetical protein
MGASYEDRARIIGEERARAGLSADIGPDQWAAICEEIARSGNLRRAAARASTEPRHVRRLAREDPDYGGLLEDAWEDYKDCVLLPSAQERAVEGVVEPVYFQGRRAKDIDEKGNEIPAGKRSYSDGLLMRLLEVHDKRFRPHQVVEQKTSSVTQQDLDALSPAARELLEKFLAQRAQDEAERRGGAS